MSGVFPRDFMTGDKPYLSGGGRAYHSCILYTFKGGLNFYSCPIMRCAVVCELLFQLGPGNVISRLPLGLAHTLAVAANVEFMHTPSSKGIPQKSALTVQQCLQ